MTHRNEYIVHGYVNERHSAFIPVDIKQVITSFYDEAFCWYFNYESLQDLLLMSNGKYMVSDEIRYNNDVSFWLILYPNGRRHMNGFVQCYLYSKQLATNVKYCTVSFQLFCLETNTEYKSLHKFVKNGYKSSGMNYNLSRSQCLLLKHLTFRCVIDLVEIKYDEIDEYNSDYIVIYYPKCPNIKLKKKFKFEWIVNSTLLYTFKNCLNGQRFYSPEFSNWFIDTAPKGDNPLNINKFQLKLKLWKWPSKLGAFTAMINCITKVGRHSISKQYKRTLSSFDNTTLNCLGTTEYKTDVSLYKNYFNAQLLTNFLSFKLNIKILHMYDWTGAEIWPYQTLYNDILYY
eukprot:390957_1